MNKRLITARIAAGFGSATDAIDNCGWRSSTYRAHENGQNNFGPDSAIEYAKAYGVSAAWLLLGDAGSPAARTKKKPTPKVHRHDCVANIHAIADLLKKIGPEDKLLEQMEACVQVLRGKAQKK